MRKVKQLRQALIMSVFSLLVCVCMLVGSTYAWFSDTAQTGTQRITAGNLDIDLLKWSGSAYTSVASPDVDIFDKDFKWEPGATQILYLAVENKGSLAAKFNVLLTVSDGGLTEQLEYLFLTGDQYDMSEAVSREADTWESLIEKAEATEKKLDFGIQRAFVLHADEKLEAAEPELESDSICYFALAIHMKEGIANTFMNKWVEFDLSVNAVQAPDESDSFGSAFDEGLVLPEPHSYLLSKGSSDKNHVLDSAASWDSLVQEIMNGKDEGSSSSGGDFKSTIKKVVFGRWNDFQKDISVKTFSDGVPVGVEWKAQEMYASDVMGFYESGQQALYILVDDPLGSIVISGSMGNSTTGYFMNWSELTEADLSCLNTAGLKPNSADNNVKDFYYVKGMGNLFNGCSKLTTVKFGTGFITSYANDMRNMFKDCKELVSIDLTAFNTTKVTRMDNMFSGCENLKTLDLTSFNTEQCGNMNNMFKGCKALTTITLTPAAFDTEGLESMASMFDGCEALTSIDLSGFKTTILNTTKRMFYGCKALTTLDLSSFDTSNVTDMQEMFRGCSGLTSITFGDKFVVSSVDKLTGMFHTCMKLAELDLTSFGKPKDTVTITGMFRNCSKLEKIYVISDFNLSSKEPTDDNVFYGCKSLNKDATSPDVQKYQENFTVGCDEVSSRFACVGVSIRGISMPGYFITKESS